MLLTCSHEVLYLIIVQPLMEDQIAAAMECMTSLKQVHR
jgi:hypothetical protein